MDRRQVLQQIAGASILLTAGCTTILENSGSFHFAIVNHREQQYHVEFTVSDNSDEILIDGAVDIAPRPSGDEEYTALDFPDLTRVTNGDIIDAKVKVGGNIFEESFEITCNNNQNAPN
ncbi:hypothetical protein, partial [Halopiger aswanensis]|uniref:hypothetical protein n=1 Tax=Halopiger aswanensis TaxID=148449 RepID=UPI0011C36FFA